MTVTAHGGKRHHHRSFQPCRNQGGRRTGRAALSPSTRVPPGRRAPSPLSLPRPACRPTTPATWPSWDTTALLSVTIDGISSVGVEYSGPVNEMFPSFNSIEEIRVSESNNNAEFSGVADITTVSKAGTIHYHGGVFENHENTVLQCQRSLCALQAENHHERLRGHTGRPVRIPHFTSGNVHIFLRQLRRAAPAARNAHRSECSLERHAQRQCRPTISPGRVSLPSISPTELRRSIRPAYRSALSPRIFSITCCPCRTTVRPAPTSNNYQHQFSLAHFRQPGRCPTRSHHFVEADRLFARFSYKNRQVTSAPAAFCTYTYCQMPGARCREPTTRLRSMRA